MKKLMIALAVAVCAVVVNAASFNWTSSGMTAASKTINSKAGTALYSDAASYTLILFDAGVTSQDTLLAGFAATRALQISLRSHRRPSAIIARSRHRIFPMVLLGMTTNSTLL